MCNACFCRDQYPRAYRDFLKPQYQSGGKLALVLFFLNGQLKIKILPTDVPDDKYKECKQ